MRVQPLPGNMIVKVESLYKDSGLIKIPKRYKKTPHPIGTITAISMRPEDRRTLGVDLVVGNRIVFTPLGGRELSDGEMVYPITLIRKDER
ncbi:MAG: hypothetical protein Q7J98_14010, partial [Kiritimatiellia bacterium]|nr:hypothetical protein [Kiritimatiellia bacterium]